MTIKNIFILAILPALPTIAFADPAQFGGLLTNSAVYSDSWSYPPIPDFGGTYFDPIFNTTTKRVNAMTDCLVDGSHTTPCNTRQFYPDYSKQVAWNSDGSKYLVKDDNAWYHLYDTATDTDIRRIVDATGLVADNDVRWSNSDPNLIYYVYGLTLRSYNINTRAVTIIHTFSCTDGTYNGDTFKNGDEGNPSFDDRYWAGMCTAYYSSATHTISAIVYDRQTDSVIANVQPSSLCGGTCYTSTQGYTNLINWVGMSPTGNYVVINWNTGHNNESGYARGSGSELFDKNLNYLGMLMAPNSHFDVGYDVNGVEVAVMAQIDSGLGLSNEWTIYTKKLSDLSLTKVTLPCAYQRSGACNGTSYNNSWHVSLRVPAGAAMGWALFSTLLNSTSTGVGWGSNELFAVKIDTTISNGSTWRRIGRTMSIRNADYNAEPHAVMNRDFTKVIWGSNWNVNGGLVNPYIITLAADLIAPSTTSNKSGRYQLSQDVTLTCNDDTACGATTYCLSNTSAPCTPATTYSAAFKVLQNIAYQKLCYSSVDSSSNQEMTKCVELKKQKRR